MLILLRISSSVFVIDLFITLILIFSLYAFDIVLTHKSKENLEYNIDKKMSKWRSFSNSCDKLNKINTSFFFILLVLKPKDNDVGLTAPLSIYDLNPEQDILSD